MKEYKTVSVDIDLFGADNGGTESDSGIVYQTSLQFSSALLAGFYRIQTRVSKQPFLPYATLFAYIHSRHFFCLYRDGTIDAITTCHNHMPTQSALPKNFLVLSKHLAMTRVIPCIELETLGINHSFIDE